MQELQQLCGYLNFLCKAIFPGRTFVRMMYAKYSTVVNKQYRIQDSGKRKGVLLPHHHIKLDREFKLDCQVWENFLKLESASVVNRPMLDLSTAPISPVELGFYSDASANPDLGFGCVINNTSWIWGKWELGFIGLYKPSIKYLELFALCAGIFTWEFELSNIRMKVHCDNQSVVAMINNLTSSCEHCMYLLCLLVLNGLSFNRRVVAQYVVGVQNKLADALSRGRLDKFHQVTPPTFKPYPDTISSKIWPLSHLWAKNE